MMIFIYANMAFGVFLLDSSVNSNKHQTYFDVVGIAVSTRLPTDVSHALYYSFVQKLSCQDIYLTGPYSVPKNCKSYNYLLNYLRFNSTWCFLYWCCISCGCIEPQTSHLLLSLAGSRIPKGKNIKSVSRQSKPIAFSPKIKASDLPNHKSQYIVAVPLQWCFIPGTLLLMELWVSSLCNTFLMNSISTTHYGKPSRLL